MTCHHGLNVGDLVFNALNLRFHLMESILVLKDKFEHSSDIKQNCVKLISTPIFMQCNLSSVVSDKVEHLLWAAIVLIHLEGSLPTNFQENTNQSHSRHNSGARRLTSQP